MVLRRILVYIRNTFQSCKGLKANHSCYTTPRESNKHTEALQRNRMLIASSLTIDTKDSKQYASIRFVSFLFIFLFAIIKRIINTTMQRKEIYVVGAF